nr:transposase [Streptomyces sporangiiformans]
MGSTRRRCPVHFVRDVFAVVEKGSAEMAAATIRTIFAQTAAHILWRFQGPRTPVHRQRLMADSPVDPRKQVNGASSSPHSSGGRTAKWGS